MANHKSAEKAIRQTARRTAVNRERLGKMRSAVKKVEAALHAGDQEAARAAFSLAEPVMARTAQTGIVHHKNVSRKISRLSARIKSLKTA
jgi:small subunit ribosomal protein S20